MDTVDTSPNDERSSEQPKKMCRKNNVHFIDTLSSAEASLCCGEAGEKEKGSAGNYTFYFLDYC